MGCYTVHCYKSNVLCLNMQTVPWLHPHPFFCVLSAFQHIVSTMLQAILTGEQQWRRNNTKTKRGCTSNTSHTSMAECIWNWKGSNKGTIQICMCMKDLIELLCCSYLDRNTSQHSSQPHLGLRVRSREQDILKHLLSMAKTTTTGNT